MINASDGQNYKYKDLKIELEYSKPNVKKRKNKRANKHKKPAKGE